MNITPLQFSTLFPKASKALLAPLNFAMVRYDIDSTVRTAAFLAQVGVESAGLTKFVEGLYYTDATRAANLFRTAFDTDRDKVISQEEIAFASGYLRDSEKMANRAYANRNGNGNEASGDGYRYRGRGPIMVTGLANYRKTGIRLGLDLVVHPELLEQPEPACYSAGDYWSINGCNTLADAGKFDAITAVVNGAQTGAVERRALWEKAKVILR